MLLGIVPYLELGTTKGKILCSLYHLVFYSFYHFVIYALISQKVKEMLWWLQFWGFSLALVCYCYDLLVQMLKWCFFASSQIKCIRVDWFPIATRYSIWLDSKLRLQADPMLTLEYFLWRKGSEYAISNHYDRHCVWEEVLQNKRLNKYNHTAIDEQFQFYQSDGLIKFNATDESIPLPSCA